jgi:hypothetical protein
MTDLHKTSDPKYTAQIDTVGWIFIAFAVAITVIAAVVAYHGSGTMIANTPYRAWQDRPARECYCRNSDRCGSLSDIPASLLMSAFLLIAEMFDLITPTSESWRCSPVHYVGLAG